jgi:hypothetical protein
VQSDPDSFSEVWWGKRLVAVRVDLRRVSPETVATMLEEAWELRAPKRLLADRR